MLHCRVYQGDDEIRCQFGTRSTRTVGRALKPDKTLASGEWRVAVSGKWSAAQSVNSGRIPHSDMHLGGAAAGRERTDTASPPS